jgi:tyrosyl-tRNA synthetase
MAQYSSEFLNTLEQRGFIHQGTDLEGLDKKLSEGPCSAYIGFDATASSLHVGSLVPIMLLTWFQKTGHKPITLMGGGTTKVGDPSGKDKSRQLLDDAAIDGNIESIKRIFAQFLTYDESPSGAMMVNNDDWLKDINYIDFLRDYGRHFSINRMLSFDSVKLRLDREQPLSFLEFNYMILQAYDFVALNRAHNVILQMGGSDQWGNMVNGVELGRRCDSAELFAVTAPLLTTASGAKMGKTADGAVWLNEDMLPAYDYYQYWRNTEDADVGRFLKLFTMLPMDEIARLEALEGAEINEAKKILAFEATRLCRGEAAAIAAQETAVKTFEQGALGDDLPSIDVSADELSGEGVGLLELLKRSGLAASNGEGRRLVQGGGVRINDEKVSDPAMICTIAVFNGDTVIKLSAGKKKHALVKLAG